MAKGHKTGKPRTYRGLLDYVEMLLLIFFVVMDSIALLFIPTPIWSKITIVVAAVVLVTILVIKFYRKSREWKHRLDT